MPGTPSRTIAQSCPGDRRRRVSQPSYSLPLCPNSVRATGGCGRTRFSRAAKNSSLAATTAPPRARLARSGRRAKSVIVLLGTAAPSLWHAAAQQPAERLVPGRLATEPRPADGAGEGPARVRGDRVPVLELSHRPLLVGREGDQVGVAAGCDRALARQAGEAGGRLGHPVHHLRKGDAAGPGAGPHHGQGHLERGDPAPGGAEVTGVEPLQVGRAWRVVA